MFQFAVAEVVFSGLSVCVVSLSKRSVPDVVAGVMSSRFAKEIARAEDISKEEEMEQACLSLRAYL